MDIDWDALTAAANDVMRAAYAPYSKFPVGAAALVDDGRVIRGCNVENASYGLTLCAECGLVSALHASGGGRLVAMVCVNATGDNLMPCGRCRQLLWENGGPAMLIQTDAAPVTMAELLPMAFGEADLDAAAQAKAPRREQPAPHLRDMLGRGTVFVHPETVDGERAWTAYWDGSTGVGHERGAILDEAPTVPEADEMIAWGLARTRRVIVIDSNGEMFWAGEGPAPAEVARKW